MTTWTGRYIEITGISLDDLATGTTTASGGVTMTLTGPLDGDDGANSWIQLNTVGDTIDGLQVSRIVTLGGSTVREIVVDGVTYTIEQGLLGYELSDGTLLISPYSEGGNSNLDLQQALNAGGTIESTNIGSISDIAALMGPESYTMIGGPVDGEETGETMGIGYDDAGQATDGGGDIIDGADGLNDTIFGNGGDDTIFAGFGDDVVDGGADNDSIDGGAGNDSIDGGAGEDTIFGGLGDDVVDGGADNDSIDGGAGEDTVCGGDGDDTLSGGAASGVVPSGVYEALSGSTETFVDNTGQTVTYTQTLSGDARELADSNFFWSIEDADQFASFVSASTVGYNRYSFDNPVNGLRIQWAAMNDGETMYFTVDGVSFNLNTAIANGTVTYVDGNGFVNAAGGIGGASGAQIADPGTLIFNIPVSTVEMVHNVDAMTFGAAVEGSVPATDDDVLKGDDGDDTFILVDGNDTIADFNTGNSGAITDGDQTNNDFVDLSGYYNLTTLAAYNAANAGATFATPLEWMQADQADDGILNDTIAGWDADNTLTIENGGVAVAGTDLTFDNTNVACFTRGTMIATKAGLIAIEDLKTGDQVMTMDNGYQEIRWIGSNAVSAEALAENSKLVPIRIEAGALGNGLPEQDLLVSPQHRVMVRSQISERMFDMEEVLIPANKLLTLDGIDIAWDAEEAGVEYWHFLFDAHQIVWSNSAPTESLFTGPEALKAISPEAREEITVLFPEIIQPDYIATSARPIPEKGRQMKKLAYRHQKNGKPLVREL